MTNRFNRGRPFYGPNIDPETAFKANGAAAIDGAQDGAYIASAATTGKRQRESGYSTTDKKPAMKPSDMPVVKPKDYEEFLQSYLNAQPSIGDTNC